MMRGGLRRCRVARLWPRAQCPRPWREQAVRMRGRALPSAFGRRDRLRHPAWPDSPPAVGRAVRLPNRPECRGVARAARNGAGTGTFNAPAPDPRLSPVGRMDRLDVLGHSMRPRPSRGGSPIVESMRAEPRARAQARSIRARGASFFSLSAPCRAGRAPPRRCCTRARPSPACCPPVLPRAGRTSRTLPCRAGPRP